ncbi:PadR family transcriptional regulator [Pelagibacterium xiamenense]|uniref:PadR family transcriptional regulator n=1 Tax=Pelagibacterium xiamenense TaxID=2901140 RepID=UPI001E4E3BF7|nr:PadR family transcriptional regulator [Pelagibacterium xiamenense]MCD7059410.1 PadR family transcriptional regulator [Pelagibacterium xiamenense]
MSATRLLVLAIVRAHRRAHGYLVGQDLLAWQADKWANTKTGSIYHALRQLSKDGFLHAIEIEATETVPARTDYEMTEAGEEEFQRLMAKALIEPEPRPDFLCAGIVFMSALPRETVLKYLRKRRDILFEHKTAVLDASGQAQWTGSDALPQHVEALLSFWMHNTSCAYDWIQGLIGKIEGGAYVFANEDNRAFGQPGARVAFH